MPRILYLHVGMPKCASTTIQGVLKVHADTFEKHDKFYGIPPDDTTERQGNAAVLLANIRRGFGREVYDALDFFFDRSTDVILSSEMFVGIARNTQAERLVEIAKEKGLEPRLICYVRRQDHWIESDYKQHIKGGSDWVDPIESLIAYRRRTQVLDYHWMLENWTRSIPKEHITVVPLERGQSEHYPLRRFLQFLDMDPELAAELVIERQNVSPLVGLIEPARFLKRAMLEQGETPLAVAKRLRRFWKLAPDRISLPGRRFLLTHRARAGLLKKYEESNARLSSDYLNGVPAFNSEIEEDPASEIALSVEAGMLLAAWIAADFEQLTPLPQKKNPDPELVLESETRKRWWGIRRG